MRLDEQERFRRLVAHDHGILATVHPERGVDAVPVCFAVIGAHLVVPIDAVKPKATTDLQRRANLDHDPRATLLVEHWDAADWSRLWWVRAELRRADVGTATIDRLTRDLREKYEPYRDTTFADLLTFAILRTSGWAAAS